MEVEALRAEAGELASRLLLSDQALQETRRELQASKARLARARQQNAVNKLSLHMWDSLRSGEGEGEGLQGRGANVSEARDPEANEAFVRMRRRVGELEIECSQYQERLTAANVLLRACTCHGGADGGTERHKVYADHDDSKLQRPNSMARQRLLMLLLGLRMAAVAGWVLASTTALMLPSICRPHPPCLRRSRWCPLQAPWRGPRWCSLR
eukprot:Tamp_19658.p1 GENE.Tamp_19658~~Tamp_19658.p1  ORF type:complete len:211 (+),score=23.53 Tamp_19658:551-1183(+)